MLDRARASMLVGGVTLLAWADAAVAQRPGQQTGAPPTLSVDKILTWLANRPGVWVAVGLAVEPLVDTFRRYASARR